MSVRKRQRNRKSFRGKQAGRKPAPRGRKPKKWVHATDEELLQMRICDLGVTLRGTWIEDCIEKVLDNLASRRLRFRPHFWLSEEWFTPDGIPGVAIPFYLAHPRLMDLERRMMLEVEGGTFDSCVRILRHEMGHAIDHAYQLHRRRKWQEVFGKSSKPYPEYYRPRPISKKYVINLDLWYAQSHPDEDFAETFAVWLKPRAIWRKRYQGWPALKKLEYVDELMAEIADTKPKIATKATVEPAGQVKTRLFDHYEAKQERYGSSYPDFYDHDLRRLFSDREDHRKNQSAAAFLRQVRPEIRRMVSKWTGEYQYALDIVLSEMIGRCRELKLRVVGSPEQIKMDFAILLTVQAMNHLHSGRRRVFM